MVAICMVYLSTLPHQLLAALHTGSFPISQECVQSLCESFYSNFQDTPQCQLLPGGSKAASLVSSLLHQPLLSAVKTQDHPLF